ncbi:MAG: BamA/TamA family outer membrane protein [Acidobacteriia bacterium]|nr:BamA/TamA family outer membrane protein [Terriglobia bacterium]
MLAGAHQGISEESWWGQPVKSIHLQCDANLQLTDFPGRVTQKVGEPLDSKLVAESLKNLYATGRFTDLRAEAQPADRGVNLVLVAHAQYFVGVVQVEGAPGSVEARVLLTASRLRLGQPLSKENLQSAHENMVEVLHANGFYQARIEHTVDHDPNTLEANLLFEVFPGKPARLSAVEFQDHSMFPPARLSKEAGWRRGAHLTSARLERGLFRLQQFYVKQDRLQSIVSVQKREFDPKVNTEKLIVQADAGPKIRVRVQGAKISRSKLRSLLPVFRDGVVDDVALARSTELLQGYYQEQGYLAATVKPEKASQPGAQTIDLVFQVGLGRRAEFDGYGVKGNRQIATAELMPVVNPPAQGLFSNALTSLYQARGFLNVHVTPQIDKEFEHQAGHWFVTFQINEGPRTAVRNLTLKGVNPAEEKEIWRGLVTKPSQPYSPERALTDRNYIADYLADRGYAQASVASHATPVASRPQVDLEYEITTGTQEQIQRIFVLGNHHTRPGVIRRELTIRDGQPLSQNKLLESQRGLYDLGVFNQVQMATQDVPASEPQKTVLVGVEEARRWTVGYGGGIDVQRLGGNQPQGTFQASPRLSLDVSRLDVGGRAQTLSLGGKLSNLESGGSIGYLIPRVFNRRDLSLHINGLVDRSRDVLTFTADRREASINIEKRFSPTTLFVFRYSFRRVQALDINASRISVQQIPLFSLPARVGGLGASYINDHRDDPADATRGSYTLADASAMWEKFGSEANFLRFSGQNATYYRLGSHLIFARDTRFGVESPFGGLRREVVGQPPQVVFTHDIPLPERFFMGGSEAHRGFSINQAGPRDPTTGFPVGGNALFLNTLELRVPLAQRRFGFTFFHDVGNVFSSIRTMRLLKFTQSSPTDFDYDVNAVGMGIRYKTPVGPLRLDFGYNLNPPRYQVITTTNGISTVGVQRLPNFQFFLSVGQSF